MGASDTVIIVAAVAGPIVFFALLFVSAIWYRKRSGGTLMNHPEWGKIPTPRSRTFQTAYRRPTHCGQCSEKNIQRPSWVQNGQGSPQTVIDTSRAGPSVYRRKESVIQPHFAESTTSIRRISASRSGQGDTIQRINSITSSLSITEHTPDKMPYGGRKSSMTSITYDKIRETNGGAQIGDRKLSVLTDPDEGVINLRRVSVGGGEDVVRVRSGSQSQEARRRTLGPVVVGFTEVREDVCSPVLSPSHPFSKTQRTGGYHQADGFKLQPPPIIGSRVTNSTPNDASPSKDILPTLTPINTISAPETGGSMEALKSPQTAFSVNNLDSESRVFQAWKGFQGRTTDHNLPDPASLFSDPQVEQPLSPKTPLVGSEFPVPYLTFPVPQITGTPRTPISPPTPIPEIRIDSIFPTTPKIDFTRTPGSTSPALARSPSSPLDTSGRNGVISPGAGNDGGDENEKRKSANRITHLAQVVQENEEKRKSLSEQGSSTVALASLERRVKSPRL